MKLRGLGEADLPMVEAWLSDEKLMYYMDTERPNPDLGVIRWGIESGGKLIGWASLVNIDDANSKAEYGIAIPGHQPLACYKATIQILRFAFMVYGLNRVYVRPLQSNLTENDQRERFGFIREGIERQSVRRGDKLENVIIMSMLKEEFIKKGW